MKNTFKNYIAGLLFLTFIIPSVTIAQQGKTVNEKIYKYEIVKNDPLHARIYKLDNGLTVYLTVYKDAPRIQTYIAVRAGSKNDPADATGLAHYLEHMLFKGTDKYSTKEFAKEEPLVNQIEQLYETYRKTTDEQKRIAIYHVIDSVSGVASKYAIANEYDKMMAAIGAKETNAHTWVEETVYQNDIPSNQLEKWLTIEADRFRNPVMRLFHTELEAVYEEKNRNLDSDGSKAWEALFEGLWQKHSYGTQTTIGTIEHLKNPSLTEIKKYYNTYYVPNNMAICLSGDFDPDATIKLIDQKFSIWKNKPVPAFNAPKENPITQPIVKEVVGPDAETMVLGYRFDGANSKDIDMITIISRILFNGKAGLMDLNLNQKQKILNSNAFEMILKDYSALILSADPKQGQTLEEAKDLLLSQIEQIKKGEFQDWLLSAIINDMKLLQTKENEKNSSRASALFRSFILDQPWQDYVNTIDRLSKITKQEIMDFSKSHFKDNYVVVYKRTGEDNSVQKVIKPQITPVEVNRNDQSPFLQNIVNATASPIEPVFIDYSKDIKIVEMKDKHALVLYSENKENETFNLYYVLAMGSNNNKKLGIAIDYLQFLGTSKFNSTQIQEEFYKIGCSFSVSNSEDQIYVSLSGLTENFDKGLQLFESLLSDAQPNNEALKNLIADNLKKRADSKLNKGVILQGAMYNYGMYGAKSPFTNVLSEKELNALTAEELVAIIKSLNSYEHHILYYGPKKINELLTSLNAYHKAGTYQPLPPAVNFEELATEKTVYVVDYDMKQAEIIMLSKSEPFNKTVVPVITLFNEYFGGSMSSVVFQDMRESKALAYSVYSSYRAPNRKEKSNYVFSYIGTQSDKLPEAIAGMMELMTNMPESDVMFSSAKDAVFQKLRTERITKSNILFNYEKAKKMGLTDDIRRDVYNKIPSMTMSDIRAFQQKYIKDKNYTMLVLGKKESLDMKTLEKYGKVKFLTLQDVFGY